MPLQPDDTICYCFHVPYRKIEAFCKIEKPQAASQISECLSAGTGCGWCVPMLKKIHLRICGEHIPWWRQTPGDGTSSSPITDEMDALEYREGRARYIKSGKGTPPAGAVE